MRKIKLSKNKCTLVDNDIFELIKGHKWHATLGKNQSFYAHRTFRDKGNPKSEMLHHYVIGHPLKGYVTDHINGVTLDNRRKNLRTVTYLVNSQNKQRHRKGSLVGAQKVSTNKWRAQIRKKNKTYTLGYFSTEIEAHLSYIKALKEKSI